MKRILLLTDFPPCEGYTGGLVLDQLCRFLPEGSLSCFCILNPDLPVRSSEDLKMVTKYATKPSEQAHRPGPRWWGSLKAFQTEWYHKTVTAKKLAREVVDFAAEQNIDAIWSVLEGQTLVRVTLEVAKRVKIPIHTLVWDPIGWWLRANNIDKLTSHFVQKDFESVMRISRSCASASWNMSDEFSKLYGTRCVEVISSLPKSAAKPPAIQLNNDHEISIGLAGQLYAEEEWKRFILALDLTDWKIGGRTVKVKLLGAQSSPLERPNIEFLGWQQQSVALQMLSKMDMFFCPYPFAKEMADVSRVSFPSKLVSYLAAGRPTIFHGPTFASPARYIRENNVGMLATREDTEDLLKQITTLVSDPTLYRALSENAHNSFMEHFTLETMRNNFLQALEIQNPLLLKAPIHCAASKAAK